MTSVLFYGKPLQSLGYEDIEIWRKEWGRKEKSLKRIKGSESRERGERK